LSTDRAKANNHQSRIIADLWKKYNTAKHDFKIATQEIHTLERTIEGRKRDKALAAYWMEFYQEHLELVGEDVSEE
jgi:hypothetical protein